MVDAATRAFYCPRSAGPDARPAVKAGKAPAEGGAGKGVAFRWAAVVSCTAAVLAGLVLVGAPSAAADRRAWRHLGPASRTGPRPEGG